MMSDLPGIVLLSLRILLALCLYFFLAWAVRIIWQDLRQTHTASQDESISPLQLTVEFGEAGPATHFLTNPENILGRGANCDIHLPEQTVSSKHARIYYEHRQWWLEDLGSSNGTFLNDIPLLQPAVLTDHDRIMFGKVTAEIKIQEGQDLTLHDFREGNEL